MELLQLEYFRVAAQTQSITKAAAQLHLSQPSLSISISRLEKELGVRLFDRVGGRIRLNDTGRRFLRRAERIFTELNEARLELADGEDGGKPVSVGASNVGLCSDLFTGYMRRYPQQRVRLFNDAPEALCRRLESGELDFAVSTRPLRAPEIEWQTLLDERLVILTAQDSPLAGRDFLTLPELANERFVVQCSAAWAEGEYMHIFNGQPYTPDAVFFTNELETAFHMVELGVGILVCSYLTAQRMMKNPNHLMRAVPLQMEQAARPVGLARWKGHYLTRSAQRLFEYAADFFRRLQHEQQLVYEGSQMT